MFGQPSIGLPNIDGRQRLGQCGWAWAAVTVADSRTWGSNRSDSLLIRETEATSLRRKAFVISAPDPPEIAVLSRKIGKNELEFRWTL
jgi:hypothetical protein